MRRAMLCVALAAVAGGVTPARAAAPWAVLAGPQSSETGYTTRVVAVHPGDSWTLVNTDIVFHTLRSLATGSDEQPWCGPRNPGPEGPNNPRRYPLGECPLFWSDVALPLGGSRPILGADLLESGRTYAFTCEIFDSMRGLVAAV